MKIQKIFLAGHEGMVGSAIYRNLSKRKNIETFYASKIRLDLLSQDNVKIFLSELKPDVVILAAAKVGGIYANNKYPAEFIYENLQIQNNIIHAAHLADVQKILFLGSSCVYPRLSSQPIKEDALLTNSLEPSNEPYAIAKIAGIKMCESYNRQYNRDYRSVMPTNLYGPGDNFHPENSHVLPALVSRFHKAKVRGEKKVLVWGTGKPKREFLHVDDMADASLFVMNLDLSTYKSVTSSTQSHINIGFGKDISILELAEMIMEIVGFKGNIIFDNSRPDGSPQKLLDSSVLDNLGWQKKYSLRDGLEQTYQWFLENKNELRSV